MDYADATPLRRLVGVASTNCVRDALKLLADYAGGVWWPEDADIGTVTAMAKALLQVEADATSGRAVAAGLKRKLDEKEAQLLDVVAEGTPSTRLAEELATARETTAQLTEQLSASFETLFDRTRVSVSEENVELRKEVASLRSSVRELQEQLLAVRKGAPSGSLDFLGGGEGKAGTSVRRVRKEGQEEER
jgi:hypothetical protein